MFDDIYLAPPTLNISAFWIPFIRESDGLTFDGVRFWDMFGETHANTSKMQWVGPDQKLYDLGTITALGRCQTVDVSGASN